MVRDQLGWMRPFVCGQKSKSREQEVLPGAREPPSALLRLTLGQFIQLACIKENLCTEYQEQQILCAWSPHSEGRDRK